MIYYSFSQNHFLHSRRKTTAQNSGDPSFIITTDTFLDFKDFRWTRNGTKQPPPSKTLFHVFDNRIYFRGYGHTSSWRIFQLRIRHKEKCQILAAGFPADWKALDDRLRLWGWSKLMVIEDTICKSATSQLKISPRKRRNVRIKNIYRSWRGQHAPVERN